jgi:glutathione S-transferase
MAVLERLDIEFVNKDIAENPEFADELMARGGKLVTPYLVDEAAGVEMYESDDIVAHLQKRYGSPVVSSVRPRVHVGGSTCISCEG